uniref:Uncharacterized protein n=1 Tax=Acrobeloides nanus TaxID=290746 RepID=A0A914D3X4_9BILA
MKLFVVLAVFIFALYIVENEAQTQQECKDQVTAFCTAHKTDYKTLLKAANKSFLDKANKKASKCVAKFCKNKKIPKKCLKTKMLCTAASVCVAATSLSSSG